MADGKTKKYRKNNLKEKNVKELTGQLKEKTDGKKQKNNITEIILRSSTYLQ